MTAVFFVPETISELNAKRYALETVWRKDEQGLYDDAIDKNAAMYNDLQFFELMYRTK
jgi:hypothetical protein